MAACESPLPESPVWNNKMNPNLSSSFGDIFWKPPPPLFHHPPTPQEITTPSPSSSSSFWSTVSSLPEPDAENEARGEETNLFSVSHKKSESLQLCTEGLGFESFDDVEDNLSTSKDDDDQPKAVDTSKQIYTPRWKEREFRRTRSVGGGYPPPIPSISVSGKPWVCFKSYRQDGRFVLKEERIPTQEVLHASREDGRLRLHFVHRPEEEVQLEDQHQEIVDEKDDDDDS